MTRIVRMALAAALAGLLAACAGNGGAGGSGGGAAIEGVAGKTVYTQRNLWVISGEHETTNYRRGEMIPVNSKVRIDGTGRRTIQATVLESGRSITVINVAKYTKKDIRGIYDRYFAVSPVDMSRFGADERRAIKAGRVERGMSKDAVLIARGYPPAHETPSTEQDEWRYWKGSYNTVLVRFDNDRVSSIKD